jgi:diguanylate cyclase (GGDEF)-like protein/PAS domain S-box-containing protein
VVGYTRDLREVKAAEAKAKNEEYQRLIMLDSMPMGCNLWDDSFKLIDCNHEAAKMLGFTDKAEYIKCYDKLSPEFQPDGEPSKQKAARLVKGAITEGACNYEWLHRTLDGELVPTAKTIFGIDVGNGKIGLVGYTRDLREKKAADAEIAKANERQRVMIDHLPMGCVYLSKNIDAIDCNREVLKIFGIPRKQDFLDHFQDLFPELQPDGRPSLPLAREYVDYAIANGRVTTDWLHRNPKGEPIPMEITLVSVVGMTDVSLVAYMQDLREKKAAEAEIAEANEHFRVMFDNTPLACIYFTKDMRAIDCNDETLKIFGYSNKQELIGTNFKLFPEFQPDGKKSLPQLKEHVNNALINGRVTFDWFHHTINGDLIPVEVTVVRAGDAAGANLVAYIRDLREKKAAEAQIAEANERFKVMFGNTPLGCMYLTKSLEPVDCSDETLNIFGFSNKQDLLDSFPKLFPDLQPDGTPSLQMAHEYGQSALANGRITFEWLHQTLDGEPLPMEITLVRVNTTSGLNLVSYMRDLRDKKAAEAKIAEANEHFKIMFDNIPLGCFYMNSDMRILDCNDEILKIFGFSGKHEVIGHGIQLATESQPDGRPSLPLVKEYIDSVLATNGRSTFEWHHKTRNGDPLPLEITLVKAKGTVGANVVVYVRDLREKKAAEAQINQANERFRLMFDNTPLGCIYFTEDMRAIDCNDETLKIFGYSSKQELIGNYFEMFPELQPDGRPSLPLAQEYVDYVLANGRLVFEWLHKTRNGDTIPTELTLVKVRDAAGTNLVVYIRDLREKKAAEAEIAEANERFRLMFDNNPLGCIYFTKDMYAVDCNEEVLYIFGFSSKREFIDRFHDIFPEFQPDGRPSLPLAHEYVNLAIANGRVVFEWLHQTIKGDQVPVEITLVRVRDAAGTNLVAYIRDLRELKDKTARLNEAQKMAFSDSLTGISNRRSFLQKSKHEFKTQQDQSPIGIIMLDIDYFKRVNDTYGHEAGDEVLKVVSENIGSVLRETDLFARYGGEEFIVMVQHLELPELTKLAERICEKIRNAHFSYAGQKIAITISAGVAMRNETSQTIEQVIKHADVALYRAKANGRDRVETLDIAHLDDGDLHPPFKAAHQGNRKS